MGGQMSAKATGILKNEDNGTRPAIIGQNRLLKPSSWGTAMPSPAFTAILLWQAAVMRSIFRSCRIIIYLSFIFFVSERALAAEYIFPQVANGSTGSLAYITTVLI